VGAGLNRKLEVSSKDKTHAIKHYQGGIKAPPNAHSMRKQLDKWNEVYELQSHKEKELPRWLRDN
jgi:hypothetical protein